MKVYIRLAGMPGVSNVGVVQGHHQLFRSARPADEAYANLPGDPLRIKTVLCLQTHSDRELVEAVGMRSIEFPLSALSEIPGYHIQQIIGAMNDPANWPMLVHCRQGHDRTGVICACYRIRYQDWSVEEAMEEMQAYGFNDLWQPLKRSIDGFARRIRRDPC